MHCRLDVVSPQNREIRRGIGLDLRTGARSRRRTERKRRSVAKIVRSIVAGLIGSEDFGYCGEQDRRGGVTGRRGTAGFTRGSASNADCSCANSIAALLGL